MVYASICSSGSVDPSYRSRLKPFHLSSSGTSMMVLVKGCRRVESVVTVVRAYLTRHDSSSISVSRGGGRCLSSPRSVLGWGERCRTCRRHWSVQQKVLPPPASFSSLRSPYGEPAAPTRSSEQSPQSSSSSRPSLSGETATTSSGQLQSFSPYFWLRPSTFFLQLVSFGLTVGTNCSC